MPAYPMFPDSEFSCEDIRLAAESSRILSDARSSNGSLCVTVTGCGHETVKIPATVVTLLVQFLTEVSRGGGVMSVSIPPRLTPQQVADLLGVSVGFLDQEIDAGQLTTHGTGAERVILYPDFVAYARRVHTDQQKILDALSALDQEQGLQ